jgi:hypothetical protein
MDMQGRNVRYSARPDVFEDLAVTARRALVHEPGLSTPSQPGSPCSGHVSRPPLPERSGFCAHHSLRRSCHTLT